MPIFTSAAFASQPGLGFLKRDIEKQREIAESALARAKAIGEFLQNNPDAQNREELEKARQALLTLARDLARNASDTSSSAITSVTSATTATG